MIISCRILQSNTRNTIPQWIQAVIRNLTDLQVSSKDFNCFIITLLWVHLKQIELLIF